MGFRKNNDEREGSIARIALTPNEAAIATGRTRTRIFRAIHDGDLIARKDGKATLIEVTELQRWVSAMPIRERDAAPRGAALAKGMT